MSRPNRIVTLVAALVMTAAAVTVAAESDTASTSVIGGDTCCFTNPQYTGVCEVTTGPDETCADVLAYLNNEASVGKTYCGNTQIRGGWQQVDCEDSSATCASNETSPDTAGP